MAEGGTLPWKIQKLNLAPSLSYDSIHKPLRAPKGKRWNFDHVHKEWSLVAAGEGMTTASASSTSDFAAGSKIVDSVDIIQDKDGTVGKIKENMGMKPPSSFLDHFISPSDTFQGICLKYKISPLELRRANGGFSGENLNLVPNPLKIPSKDAVAAELTQDQVVDVLLKECRSMSRSEARAYLMLEDWDLNEALRNAHEDGF
eukprot:CAMPEP_0197183540 /NCGR_PEP_ID=MMETSP1423-20130617/7872_1 /TAXON_ID=476441 /ORGANISM="Pseudo-nitzschia heimii, Strain UNC1101" /LENGTH=201 /DNA_ID=CAMNT_0042634125 /DNA_START=101 /DNA_END=706 /DNA_ORIENTATION=+